MEARGEAFAGAMLGAFIAVFIVAVYFQNRIAAFEQRTGIKIT